MCAAATPPSAAANVPFAQMNHIHAVGDLVRMLNAARDQSGAVASGVLDELSPRDAAEFAERVLERQAAAVAHARAAQIKEPGLAVYDEAAQRE
jgi:hypothetical protein